jgi:hypothetical protein
MGGLDRVYPAEWGRCAEVAPRPRLVHGPQAPKSLEIRDWSGHSLRSAGDGGRKAGKSGRAIAPLNF